MSHIDDMIRGDLRGNPYQRREIHRFDESSEPVLTLSDLEALVRSRIARERHVFAAELAHACEKAWDEGDRHGRTQGERAVRDAIADEVGQVIRGNLNHIERRLLERRDAPKTTIMDDRTFMVTMAAELNRAILRLSNMPGSDR
jgi:hypothetical protein